MKPCCSVVHSRGQIRPHFFLLWRFKSVFRRASPSISCGSFSLSFLLEMGILLPCWFFFLDRNRQGAKKVIFTACHSGKLNLTFTSPNIISTSTKNVLMSRLISQFSCILNSSKNFTCPSGKLITEFTSPIAKSSSPGLSDTAFFAR